MAEKILYGEFPMEGVKRNYTVHISPTMEGIKFEKDHKVSYGWDSYALICIPGEYSLVLESDRLADIARIAELEAQVAELKAHSADTLPAPLEEMVRLWEAMEVVGFALLQTDNPTINAYASQSDNTYIVKFGDLLQHKTVHSDTLPAAIIALAKEVDHATD